LAEHTQDHCSPTQLQAQIFEYLAKSVRIFLLHGHTILYVTHYYQYNNKGCGTDFFSSATTPYSSDDSNHLPIIASNSSDEMYRAS
jgi:hypothetical protein